MDPFRKILARFTSKSTVLSIMKIQTKKIENLKRTLRIYNSILDNFNDSNTEMQILAVLLLKTVALSHVAFLKIAQQFTERSLNHPLEPSDRINQERRFVQN
ncbi:uncharacterized protein [Epargyreus clarus]|uniref:uncharacterized protein n=1 Tax=Epargyreus clarus TaxID=520877 RepID=UPI003C2BC11C